jgi:glycosyltransferase involved in cell wall biosynthesis
MTTLSVVLCTYNGARFLEEQLTSIASQTRTPDELVVFDDASTDTTPLMLERFAKAASFPVRLQVNPRNEGVSANFERAIAAATGELIALADQDDVWLPAKLGRAEAALRADATLGLVFCDAEVIDAGGKPSGFSLWESIGFDATQQQEVRLGNAHRVLERRNVVTGAACVFRAELRGQVLPLSRRWVHDAWIAAICSVTSRLLPLPHRDLRYRRHAGQQVGARPPRNLRWLGYARQRLRGAALDREADLRRSVDKLDDLLERLKLHATSTGELAALDAFEARHLHLLARLHLPGSLGPRLAKIAGELAMRRYSRFSSGASSALKDLLLVPGGRRFRGVE